MLNLQDAGFDFKPLNASIHLWLISMGCLSWLLSPDGDWLCRPQRPWSCHRIFRGLRPIILERSCYMASSRLLAKILLNGHSGEWSRTWSVWKLKLSLALINNCKLFWDCLSLSSSFSLLPRAHLGMMLKDPYILLSLGAFWSYFWGLRLVSLTLLELRKPLFNFMVLMGSRTPVLQTFLWSVIRA